jgi:hypothetical protein
MQHPHPEIQVGAQYTQSDIEELFDTGFGYRISGINPRIDDSGERYILLFANEDGPYDDEVTRGEFTYIGEGLPEKGDQSLSSPGNSVLASAATEPVPIYFFFKRTGTASWEYQGQVDVQGYIREHHERDGREVFVFTMEHRSQERACTRPLTSFDDETDTAGTHVVSERAGIRISESFKRAVYERYSHRCAVTEIAHRSLLTVSHVLPRADRPDIAEDHGNVLLLNWTHHFAFDAELWTFDEAGRLWVNPDYDPDDHWMEATLSARHGDRIARLKNAGVADEYIDERNKSLDWWPPR